MNESLAAGSATAENVELSMPERIRHVYSNLGRSQQRLAQFVLDQPNEVAFLTSTQLGGRVGVSEATVVRLAMRLGFSGYPEMQRVVRESLRRTLAGPERRKREERGNQREKSAFARVLSAEQRNLADTIDSLSPETLERAVKILAESKHIYVVGGRTSYALAYLAWMLLNQVTRKALLVNQSMDTLADQLVTLGPQDALLTFATPRYTRQTVEVFRHAQRLGTQCISVTDSLLSPAADGAEVVIPIRHMVPTFFNGNVAAIAIAQALAAGLAEFKRGDSDSFLKELAESYHRWGNPFLESGEIDGGGTGPLSADTKQGG